MLSQVISENGGHTTPHGNGAYGLIGRRGGREAGLGTSLPKQAHRLMDDTYNNKKAKEWNLWQLLYKEQQRLPLQKYQQAQCKLQEQSHLL